MPTRTAFVLTIGDVIESGPPNVTPNNRRNASAPNSPSGTNVGGVNVHYKRSVSTSSKVNGRIGGASRGRPSGHYKSKCAMGGVNGKEVDELSEDNETQGYEDHYDSVNADNLASVHSNADCDSDSENSNTSSDLIFTTSSSNQGGKKSVKRMARMKTRHVSTGSTASLVNGNSEPSAAAFSQTAKNVSGGRPKKSIMKPSSKLSHDEDEEVSFSDSAPVPPTVCNGTSPSNLSNTNSRPGPACSKNQDRDKSAERRRYRHKSCSDQSPLKCESALSPNGYDFDQHSPKQNSVISPNNQSAPAMSPHATRRRINSSCSSSGLVGNEGESRLPSPNSRQLRISMAKLRDNSPQDKTVKSDEDDEELEAEVGDERKCANQGKRKRKISEGGDGNFNKRKRVESESLENSRKRRTELDKLLDAGSSSFHFETAKQVEERLGPIHINVDGDDEDDDDHHKASEVQEEESLSDAERRRPPGWLTIPSKKKKKNLKDTKTYQKKQRLLKKVSPVSSSANESTSQSKITQFFSKTTGKKHMLSPKSIPPPPKRNRGKFILKKDETEDTEDEDSDNEAQPISYLPEGFVRQLELELSQVDGTEVPVSSLKFSFEHTPAREGWFQTYTRQDQGDEILYYPEPKSFPLPYEMPISTFYPRKDKSDNGNGEKLKNKFANSRGSSKDTSVNPSGSITPIHPPANNENESTAKGSSLAAALAASNRLTDALSSSRKTRGSKSICSSIATSSQSSLLERKSPRGHASTKSLISASMGGIDMLTLEGISGSCTNLNEDTLAGPLGIPDEEMDVDVERYTPYNMSTTAIVKGDLQAPFEQSGVIDDCSNDSWAPSEYGKSVKSNKNAIPVQEDIQHYKEMSSVLDAYFLEGETDMLEGTVNPPAKTNFVNVASPQRATDSTSAPDCNLNRNIRQRQRSSGSTNSAEKPAKTHKHHHHHKHKHDKNKHRNKSEQMDHVVASNVDQILLDCLEEELPSGIVAIEGDVPGSAPLELLDDYDGCDSMIYARSSRRFGPKPRPFQENIGHDNRKSELRAVFGARGMGYLSPTRTKQDDFDPDERKHSFSPLNTESTILKRLLTDGLPTSKVDGHFGKKTTPKRGTDGLMLPPPPVAAGTGGYSSSEDTASVCSTVTTTSQSSDASGPVKRKKKRNLTGFPSPKKKRRKITNEEMGPKKPAGKAPRVKLLTAVLTQNAKKAAKAKKNMASPRRRKKLSPAESKTVKRSSLRSSRQESENAESDAITGTDSEEEASDSEEEVLPVSKRGRPPASATNQGSKKKIQIKPKKNTKVAIRTSQKRQTEWQQAKAFARERALTMPQNRANIKNIKPKKIVVSRKKYAEYKRARLAEAAAEAAAAKKPSPQSRKSISPQTKKGNSPRGRISMKGRNKPGSQLGRKKWGGKEKAGGEEESMLADVEDEESEDECDQKREQVRPPGWLTVPKGRSVVSKKIKKQVKSSNNLPLKKPKLRNSKLRNKQTTVENKSCRLT